MRVYLWAACALLLTLALVAYLVGKRIDRTQGVQLRLGWVFLVVGMRGSGKSLFVARLIADRLRAGVNVVANFTVEGCAFMQSWDDVILAPPGTMVVLDEAHQWARATGRTPDPLADWYVSHARKLGHEVWVIAQHESQIAGFVKNQTNQIVSCHKLVEGRHRAQAWDPATFRKNQARPLWSWWYSPEGAAVKVFNTKELVRPSKVVRRTKAEADLHIERLIDLIEARAAGGTGAHATGRPLDRSDVPCPTDLEDFHSAHVSRS